MDGDGIERLLGVLTERTEQLPQMASDISDFKGRLMALPCVAHTEQLKVLGKRVNNTEQMTTGMGAKVAVVWGIGIILISAVVNWLLHMLPAVAAGAR